MKQYSLVVFLLAMVSFIPAQATNFDVNRIKNNFVKVKDNLYVCRYEVSNLEYRNFLKDLLDNKQVTLYKEALPDTLAWREKLTYNEPFVEYYFRYPNYDNYPVVAVSYEAALSYCSWLSKKYNEDSKRKFKQVVFKLLSKEEWVYAANKGDTSKVYTWGSGFIQNNRKQYLCNFKHPGMESNNMSFLKSAIACPVNAFYPNSFGIYNMCGNVAEMIEENGTAKGGSYDDLPYQVEIASEKTYSKPTADIGFRVAMKIIEK